MIRPAVGAVACLLVASSAVVAQSVNPPPPPPQLTEARQLLSSGEFARAERLFASVVQSGSAVGTHAATANFGYALAIQQGMAAADSVDTRRIPEMLQGYDQAVRLNPALRVSAATNVGLLYKGISEHALAAGYFARAANAASDSTRVALWMEAAGEYELADSARLASQMFSRVIETQQNNRRAIEGLLRTGSLHTGVGDVLDWAERWMVDTSLAPAVADAILILLTREDINPRPSQARRALGNAAASLTTARFGPAEFSVRMKPRLTRLVERGGVIANGASALIDAYAPRKPDAVYTEPASAQWWHETTRERRAWSGMLRWLGDWHNQRNSTRLARSFYEAAVGKGGEYLTAEWADAKALVPLALLYAQSGGDSTGRLEGNVQDYTERLFVGKTAAYQRNDLAAIRTFHTALGSYYASTGQWSGAGARSAEFQLNRMRQVTQQLNRQGKQVSDSPELLAKLATHYDTSGKKQQADSLRTQVRTYYEVRKRPEKADSAFVRAQRPVVRAGADRTTQEMTKAVAPSRVSKTEISTVLRVQLSGHVLGPAGQALQGVKVAVIVRADTANAVTNEAGEFVVSVPRTVRSVRVIATLAGYRTFDGELSLEKPISISLGRARPGMYERP